MPSTVAVDARRPVSNTRLLSCCVLESSLMCRSATYRPLRLVWGCAAHRNLTLEAACSGALDMQYGRAAAAVIRSRLLEHPARLVINALWDSKVDGERCAGV